MTRRRPKRKKQKKIRILEVSDDVAHALSLDIHKYVDPVVSKDYREYREGTLVGKITKSEIKTLAEKTLQRKLTRDELKFAYNMFEDIVQQYYEEL